MGNPSPERGISLLIWIVVLIIVLAFAIYVIRELL